MHTAAVVLQFLLKYLLAATVSGECNQPPRFLNFRKLSEIYVGRACWGFTYIH